MDSLLAVKDSDPAIRVSTRTWLAYMAKPVKAELGEVPLRLLSRKAVEQYVAGRLAVGMAPQSILGEVKALRMALHHAVRRGWWTGDITGLLGRLELDETPEKRWLRSWEIQSFLAACDDPYHRTAALLALGAGLRIGEVLTRRWVDWDREGALLKVANCGAAGWKTKNGKTRWVPLSTSLSSHLDGWWRELGRPEPATWIVPTRDGERRRDSHWFNRVTQQACRRAGVTEITFHGLRHTFASLSLEAGCNLIRVSRILGHHSAEFTARQYVHVSERGLVEEADRLQAFLARAEAATDAASCNPQPQCQNTQVIEIPVGAVRFERTTP